MPTTGSKSAFIRLLLKMSPAHRVLASIVPVIIAFLALAQLDLKPLVFAIILWDTFAVFYLVISWLIFFHRDTDEIRKLARIDDGSRVFISFILILASLASMFTVTLLILSGNAGEAWVYVPAAICGILASWAMVHSTYTTHYAHLFYDDDEEDSTHHAAGLDFPKEKKPDYLDFAYFAFVIGMTFQVSDVAIESRHIRRVALAHGLLSFALNTFIVALTINLIAGLKN
ncbi:DUF1345 domain-containing protein [uncultured Chitinophaga sp.]|uniref:DUF1345 domain-containing protein n=1 Tax=uncultured Chitinophaga sp. TaxID=339340 RepID=UPI0025D90145|nr:DUF1345 domain-containing protein [uncultured Chitinophaga sp.]